MLTSKGNRELKDSRNYIYIEDKILDLETGPKICEAVIFSLGLSTIFLKNKMLYLFYNTLGFPY